MQSSTSKTKKGQVAVRLESGSIKACFPRTYFSDDKQVRLGTGISLVDGWEIKAAQLQRRLQLELEEGKFTNSDNTFNIDRYREILEEYGLRARLRLVRLQNDQTPPKTKLSILEVWHNYLAYKKGGLRESYFINKYQKAFTNFLTSAIQATKSEDATKIRNWLIDNRNKRHVKELLFNLSEAYKLCIKNNLLDANPFEDLDKEIPDKGISGKTQEEAQIENDIDILNSSKSYTWEEVQTILDFVKTNKKVSYWYNFIKFKFITGTRVGEAIAFMHQDIEWDKERILIRRTYDRITKKFYPLKTDKGYKGREVRRFPMPKDGELWNLLKSIPKSDDSEIVFKSKGGKIIDRVTFLLVWKGRREGVNPWKGIIPSLIEEGKLTKYLSPYNTRHSFVTHAIFDLGIDEKIVSHWCGHKVEVSNKHYQDVAIFAAQINPEVSEIQLLREELKKQKEIIERLMAKEK